MSLLQKEIIFTKWNFLDEIYIFRDSLMPYYQRIEKDGKVAKKTFLIFYLSGVDSFIINFIQVYKTFNVVVVQ